MTKEKLYKAIASAIVARSNCRSSNNTEWFDRWTERLQAYTESLPHGSGFDSDTTIDLDHSTETKLILFTSFHHMDDNGMYDGWTDHTITVEANLLFDFTLTISGRDRNGFKDYAAEVFQFALTEEIEP